MKLGVHISVYIHWTIPVWNSFLEPTRVETSWLPQIPFPLCFWKISSNYDKNFVLLPKLKTQNNQTLMSPSSVPIGWNIRTLIGVFLFVKLRDFHHVNKIVKISMTANPNYPSASPSFYSKSLWCTFETSLKLSYHLRTSKPLMVGFALLLGSQPSIICPCDILLHLIWNLRLPAINIPSFNHQLVTTSYCYNWPLDSPFIAPSDP